MNKIHFFLIAVLICADSIGQEFVSTSTSKSFRDSIGILYSNFLSSDSITKTLYKLASPEFEGRETGHPGQKIAALYLSQQYLSLGLKAKGKSNLSDSDFTQRHTMSIRANKGRNLSVNGENYLYGKHFYYSQVPKDTSLFINKILFVANTGENLKTLISGDRYSSKDIVVFDHESLYSGLNSLSENVIRPSTVFIITSPDKISSYFTNGFDKEPLSLNIIYITDTVAAQFVGKQLYDKLKSKGKRKSVVKEIECEASIGLTANTDMLCGDNVIAVIPGTDPAGEAIIISSHYDHLGIKDSSIYFGADDNASGTSALVEIARVFAKASREGFKSKRDIVFLNVSGEEKGLLGSAYYVAHPTIPLEKTVANLNIDMIGRVDSLYDTTSVKNYVYIIGADRLSTELNTINEEQNRKGVNLLLDYRYNVADEPNNFYRRSDHYNFAKNGIPIIFYFDGKHKDYHLPSDSPEKIDFNLLTKRAQLVFLTAWELANRENRIIVDKK